MAWSYADFVNNVSALDIAGVNRKYTSPPRQISTADLPAQWPQLPEAENNVVTLGHLAGLRRSAVELVIAVEPYNQGLNSTNFATSVSLIDAVETALIDNAMAIGIDEWTIDLRVVPITESTAFWALAFTVRGSGTNG